MPNVFEKQLYYYLRGTEYKLGYLVNFGTEKLDMRRRIYDTARINLRELALDSRLLALEENGKDSLYC